LWLQYILKLEPLNNYHKHNNKPSELDGDDEVGSIKEASGIWSQFVSALLLDIFLSLSSASTKLLAMIYCSDHNHL